MRTIQKTLILLGLVGILTLLAVSFACGGNGESGGNGDQPAPTATPLPTPQRQQLRRDPPHRPNVRKAMAAPLVLKNS